MGKEGGFTKLKPEPEIEMLFTSIWASPTFPMVNVSSEEKLISTPPKSNVMGEIERTGVSPIPTREIKPVPPSDETTKLPEDEP
jgi:hypothetical protein